jgi:hypothetical protein
MRRNEEFTVLGRQRRGGGAALACALLIALLAGCAKSTGGSEDETPTTPTTPKEPAVYVSGYYYDGTNTMPCYWKGTTRVDLPIDPALGPAGGKAKAIAVSEGTVYTGGVEQNEVGAFNTACYWKNTTRVDLQGALPGDGEGDGDGITAIRVSDGKVYSGLTGYWNSIKTWAGAYLVDTTITIAPHLPSGTDSGVVGLDVSDGKVYLGGCDSVSGTTYGVVWIDGVATQMDTVRSQVYGIKVSDGIVYAAGYRFDSGVGNLVPCYWKGTTRVDLPCDVSGDSRAYRIDVVDGAAYTVGVYRSAQPDAYVACYWKGDVRTDLPGDWGQGYGIAVYKGVVYTAGTIGYADPVACYWAGTTRVDLPGLGGCATGIVVVEE